jgi:proliferating cell nuclear antigen
MVYILELFTVQTSVFKTLIEALKNTLPDTNIEFDESGLKIVDTNPSKNVLVHLKLNGNSFERYTCKKKIVLGVSLTNLFKLLKTMTSSDTLTLYVDSDNTNILGIIIENTEKKCVTNYKLNLIDLNEKSIKIPATKFSSIFLLNSSDFQKVCRDMGNIGEEIDIKSVGSQLIFNTTGDFASQETIFNENSEGVSVVEQSDDIIQGKFLSKFLISFTKCTNLSSSVELFLKNDYPLIIRYQVGNMGNLKLGLSPIISDDLD